MNGAALALSPFGVEVVGVEPGLEGETRVYLGHRSKGLYFIVTGEDAERVWRAWQATFHGHLFMDRREIPAPLMQEARL